MFQLCYASQANFQTEEFAVLTDILSEARQFNAAHNITGVLFFADGYFFQCLEGEEAQVRDLFARIALDSRHQQVQLLQVQEIVTPHFQDWAMKFVGRNSQVKQLFLSWDYMQFCPLQLSALQLDAFLQLLYASEHHPFAA